MKDYKPIEKVVLDKEGNEEVKVKKKRVDIRYYTLKTGKYKDKTLKEVYEMDKSYIEFMANNLKAKMFQDFLFFVKYN